jgi:hypothetical protein
MRMGVKEWGRQGPNPSTVYQMEGLSLALCAYRQYDSHGKNAQLNYIAKYGHSTSYDQVTFTPRKIFPGL